MRHRIVNHCEREWQHITKSFAFVHRRLQIFFGRDLQLSDAHFACHGGGAFPYLAARFDIMWQRTVNARKNQAPPSTYLNRLWYDSIVYDQPTLEFLVERAGADRVLYGSDYPFTIGDMKGVLARVDALPAQQRDAIRSGNAERLFDLG